MPSGLFLPRPGPQDQGQAQLEVEAPQCKEGLPPGQAQREAAEALSQEPEVQELAQALQELGRPLIPQRAEGCKVEVPAGPDASLYIFKSETGVPDDWNVWAVVREPDEAGERWLHLEPGLELEPGAGVQGLGAGVGVMELFLPQGEALQEIAEGVKGYLESGAVTAEGVWGLQAEGYMYLAERANLLSEGFTLIFYQELDRYAHFTAPLDLLITK